MKPVGLLIRYYEDGQTEDSTYFNEDGTFKNTYHYYPNGKLWAHYTFNSKTKRENTEAYDVNGNKIEDFIFSQEASFKEGQADWETYLAENVKTKVPIKNGAPIGSYKVIIRFIVGKNGKVEDVLAETNYGYGMEEEVIRAFKKSPKWNAAIILGKTANAYRRQPLTVVVQIDK